MIHLKTVLIRMFQGKWLLVITAGLLVLGTAVSVSAYELAKKTVTLSINGKEKKVKSHADTVEGVLSENNIVVQSHDHVKPGLTTKVNDQMKIAWVPAFQVSINVDGKKSKVWTTADNVREFLRDEGIKVTEHDKITPSLNAGITKSLSIELDKAFQVNLNNGGQEKQVWTTSITVADLLKKHEIQLLDMDRVEPGKSTVVKKGTQVDVIRVEKVTDVVEGSVEYAVVKRKDNTLEKGIQKVITEGKEGKVNRHYEVILENGNEVSRKLVKTEKVADSKDRIVAVGTKTRRKTVSRSKQSQSSRQLYVSSTAYTALCSGCSGVTATGYNLKANPNAKVVAVDPGTIPLGTKVWVEGYGYATALDTGGAINGNKIDVFFNSKSEAYNWGKRTVLIKIFN